MLKCETCHIEIKYCHKRSFISHIRSHLDLNQIKFPINCGCRKNVLFNEAIHETSR